MDLETNKAQYGEMDKDEEAKNLWKVTEVQQAERECIRVIQKRGKSSKRAKRVAKEDEGPSSKRIQLGLRIGGTDGRVRGWGSRGERERGEWENGGERCGAEQGHGRSRGGDGGVGVQSASMEKLFCSFFL